ncbi:MAG: septum site-determining protein MinC [Prochloron sp. SP5CPC1]|nr:septum site-determining protein MinC [Candidatus Paraprochloron terpiosi SP5CPC1]
MTHNQPKTYDPPPCRGQKTPADGAVTKYLSLVNKYSQVHLKLEGEKLLLILADPPDCGRGRADWWSILQELKCRLSGVTQKKNTPTALRREGTRVELIAPKSVLDEKQLQTLRDTLGEFALKLELVRTSIRQTAIAAWEVGYSVKQEQELDINLSAIGAPGIIDGGCAPTELKEPLYLQTTLRSGIEVRHESTIVIWGDLNPGSTAIAAGDILVWGRLRGIAHAGALGNRSRRIVALKMEPTQLRIADTLARAPARNPERFEPEVAYIAAEGIRLAKAIDFIRTHSFDQVLGAWTNSSQRQQSKRRTDW